MKKTFLEYFFIPFLNDKECLYSLNKGQFQAIAIMSNYFYEGRVTSSRDLQDFMESHKRLLPGDNKDKALEDFVAAGYLIKEWADLSNKTNIKVSAELLDWACNQKPNFDGYENKGLYYIKNPPIHGVDIDSLLVKINKGVTICANFIKGKTFYTKSKVISEIELKDKRLKNRVDEVLVSSSSNILAKFYTNEKIVDYGLGPNTIKNRKKRGKAVTDLLTASTLNWYIVE